MTRTLLVRALTCAALLVGARAAVRPPARTLTTGEPKPRAAIALSSSDWEAILAARDAARLAASSSTGGCQLRNPGQGWSARFDDRGFTMAPDRGGWTWGLELESFGAEGLEAAAAPPAPVRFEGAAVTREWSAEVTEWYVNTRAGLEHGFTLHGPPGDGDGRIGLTLAVRGGLRPAVLDNGRDARFVDGAGGAAVTYAALTVLDADGRSLPAGMAAASGRLHVAVDGRGARYPLTVDPLAQAAYVKASNAGIGDQFGYAVSASGNTVVVGAPNEASSVTGVNGGPDDDFVDGAGAAYVFVREGATWTQQAYLKPSTTDWGDNFGWSVAISGDVIVVGAPYEDSSATGIGGDELDNSAQSAGAAYIFTRTGTTWTQSAFVKGSNTEAYDELGGSVAASGDTIVVGARFESGGASGVNGDESDDSSPGAGAAYVFVRSHSTWSQQAYVKASNPEAQDFFGSSVAVSGNTLVVGADAEDGGTAGIDGNPLDNSAPQSGAAYVFVRSGTAWSQQAYVKASNPGAQDFFGFPVAISGDTIAVGASGEASAATGVNGNELDNSAPRSGAVYVYMRTGTTWSQQAYVKASNTEANDFFGSALALSGDTLVAGAFGESSGATGLDGNAFDNSAHWAGAAYVFGRAGAAWSQKAYVKASNTGALDNFGTSVAASGGLVLVGASGEDGGSTGVNGDGASNDALSSGALYVFELDSTPGASPFGSGTPGCAGTQTLGVNHAPMAGSPHFAVTCDHAPPSSLGLCLVADAPDLAGSDPFFLGIALHVNLFAASEVLSFDLASDASGIGLTVNTAIPNDAALIGKTYYAQALWLWTSCSLPPFNLSTSRGLAITIQAP